MNSTIQSPNPYLTDPNLHPFIATNFSPVDHLNSALPSAAAVKQQHQQATPSLSAIASQTQSHISTLNALTSRLSTTLTGLTDDILRTSSRLAYEVELLRGEALSLADSLSSRGELNKAVLKFVPHGLDNSGQPTEPTLSPTEQSGGSYEQTPSTTMANQSFPIDQAPEVMLKEPEALPQLRTLLHVRTQLQTVIHRFNLALSFPLPPSLLTTTASSLVSVNAPGQDPDLESKGQSALSRLKQEVVELLADPDGRGGGIERARERVTQLRDVCTIWKGTGEERARIKWVDGLEKMVDEEVRKKDAMSGGARPQAKRETNAIRSAAEPSGSGPGFLRRLREEIYME